MTTPSGEDRPLVPMPFPPGHFYSPIVAPAELDTATLWPAGGAALPLGIDFDAPGQRRLLSEAFTRFLPDFDYPEQGEDDATLTRFYIGNSQFSGLDARAYFVLLRQWQPRRLIEVGSGYSTLLAADVNARFLDGSAAITAIEPYPRPFLDKIPDLRVIRQPVQAVDTGIFAELAAGDVLFIDSTHVAKTGSDVNHLVFDVLPRLRPGVHVHFHDIFLPNEYLRNWVLDENRSWNEQYLIRALLMDSTRYRIVFGSSFVASIMPDAVAAALGGAVMDGGSLWLDVVG